MLYETLPNTELRLSKAAVGTMSFGAAVDETEAQKVVACAVENGVNLIDTANWYNGGESERILGKILPKYSREQIVLASKIAYKKNVQGNTVTDLSEGFIVSAVEESLRRLNTDYLDICYFHAPDYSTPIDESLRAMDRLVQSGKVRCFGVSNYAAWQIVDMVWQAKSIGCTTPALTQNVYNMISRSLDTELKPCIEEKKLGLVIFNPLAGGLLSGKHHGGTPEAGTRFATNKMYYDRYWNENNFQAVEKLQEIAKAEEMTLIELAIRWCLSQKHVTSMLLGMSKCSQLEQNLQMIHKGSLSDEVLDQCDTVWNELRGHEVNYNR